MRQGNRHRHQLRRLIGSIAEHHPLIARAGRIGFVAGAFSLLKRLVDALCDIAGLLVDACQHGAGLRIEAKFGTVITDILDNAARKRWDVNIAGR